jgi:hypothetical protein
MGRDSVSMDGFSRLVLSEEFMGIIKNKGESSVKYRKWELHWSFVRKVKQCWIKNREYQEHECNKLRDST